MNGHTLYLLTVATTPSNSHFYSCHDFQRPLSSRLHALYVIGDASQSGWLRATSPHVIKRLTPPTGKSSSVLRLAHG